MGQSYPIKNKAHNAEDKLAHIKIKKPEPISREKNRAHGKWKREKSIWQNQHSLPSLIFTKSSTFSYKKKKLYREGFFQPGSKLQI